MEKSSQITVLYWNERKKKEALIAKPIFLFLCLSFNQENTQHYAHVQKTDFVEVMPTNNRGKKYLRVTENQMLVKFDTYVT